MARRFRVWLTLCGGFATLCLVTAAAQATHPRPKAAGAVRLSLVPAYNPCTAANRTHGPPLAFPSCNPPVQSSGQATVGTPDAFGGPANASSFARFGIWAGAPGPPNEGDMLLEMQLNDVRCVPTGSSCGNPNASGPSDYSGEMRYALAFRLTDHNNSVAPGGGSDPATVDDFSIEFTGPCAETASTSTGSTCTFDTTLNSIVPGAAGPDGKRTNWELSAVEIYDTGPDGDGDTTADNTVFAKPGIFIP